MNISLPDAMRDHVEAQVRSGLYSNASDYVRDLIRYDLRERDLVLAALAEGEASGVSDLTPRELLAQLKGAGAGS